MNIQEQITYFENIVVNHKQLKSFVFRKSRLKEENRSNIEYPALVIADVPELKLIGDQDNFLEQKITDIMIICSSESDLAVDISIALDTAKEILVDVISIILKDFSEEYLNMTHFDETQLYNQPIRSIYEFSSDKIYGWSFTFFQTTSLDLVYDLVKWNT